MQRIMNNPDNIVDEMVKGYVKVHHDTVEATDNPRVLKSRFMKKGKVGLVTGGGSGHEPGFLGYVGKNMMDSVAIGEIFSSPTAKAFYDAFKAADGGEGVVCLYGNYSGDNMNVKMAIKMAAKDGLEVKTVVARDDAASAPKTEPEKRRGSAAEIFMWKAAGAKAALGGSMDEVAAAGQKAVDHTRSVGVGLTPCTLPAVGHPNFKIEDGTMEIGIGHHGEPGQAVIKLETADKIAARMLEVLIPDYPFESGDEVAVMLSGLGATPIMEQYVLYDEIEKQLADKGIRVYKSYVGDYFTSLEMMGVTLSIMKVDDELKEYLDMETHSVGLTQYPKEG